MPIEIMPYGRYLRIRIENPKRFVKLKTFDVGRPGGTVLIRGQMANGMWATQAELFELEALRQGRESTWLQLQRRAATLPKASQARIPRILSARGIHEP